MENKEGEDLPEPLPDWTKSDLKEVTLHGATLSPPTAKIISILHHHNIEYKLDGGKRKGSVYKKVPVLVLNDRQINDSFIIIKNLAKIVDGQELTPEEIEFEKEMTFGFMIALEAEMIGNSKSIKMYLSKTKGGMKCFTIMCCNLCCCAGMISSKMKTNLGLNPKEPIDFSKWLKMIEERIDTNGGFLQASEIRILDLAMPCTGCFTPSLTQGRAYSYHARTLPQVTKTP